MIVSGYYYKTIKRKDIERSECPNCKALDNLQFELMFKVHHVMFVPCWANHKELLISCKLCAKQYYADDLPEYLPLAGEITNMKSPWYYFIVPVLALFLSVTFFIFIVGDTSDRKLKLTDTMENIEAGRVIYYKLDNGNKTSIYVDDVRGDTVMVRENKLSTNKDMRAIDEDQNYSDKQTYYTKQQLKQMVYDDRILHSYVSFPLLTKEEIE